MLQEPFIFYVILFHVRCADSVRKEDEHLAYSPVISIAHHLPFYISTLFVFTFFYLTEKVPRQCNLHC